VSNGRIPTATELHFGSGLGIGATLVAIALPQMNERGEPETNLTTSAPAARDRLALKVSLPCGPFRTPRVKWPFR
jgi:hypothetical protein